MKIRGGLWDRKNRLGRREQVEEKRRRRVSGCRSLNGFHLTSHSLVLESVTRTILQP